MASFTVHVELHHAEWTDYGQLYAAMEQRGLFRRITSDGGRTYQMPWAEYSGTGNFTSVQIRDIANTAAESTGKQNVVFVTEAASRAWIGLPALTSA